MEYDEILRNVGEFGCYQKKVVLLLCVIVFPTALQNLGYIFWGARPDHSCRVDQPRHLANVSDDLWRNFTTPQLLNADGQWVYAECEQYDVNLTSVVDDQDVLSVIASRQQSLDDSDVRTLPCSTWEYDMSQFDSTIVTEVRVALSLHVDTYCLPHESAVFVVL